MGMDGSVNSYGVNEQPLNGAGSYDASQTQDALWHVTNYVISGNKLASPSALNDAIWVKTGTTISANAIAGPDGAPTADKVVENASLVQHYLRQVVTTVDPAGFVLMTFKAKDAGRGIVRASLLNHYTPGNSVSARFDLTTGVVVAGTLLSTGLGRGMQAWITPLADGWYQCNLSGAPGGVLVTGTRAQYSLFQGTLVTYQGDGVSGVYIVDSEVQPFALRWDITQVMASAALRCLAWSISLASQVRAAALAITGGASPIVSVVQRAALTDKATHSCEG